MNFIYDYLSIENMPPKSQLQAMSAEELEELLIRVDKCPHTRSTETKRRNELYKNLPLWKIYRELIVEIIKELT